MREVSGWDGVGAMIAMMRLLGGLGCLGWGNRRTEAGQPVAGKAGKAGKTAKPGKTTHRTSTDGGDGNMSISALATDIAQTEPPLVSPIHIHHPPPSTSNSPLSTTFLTVALIASSATMSTADYVAKYPRRRELLKIVDTYWIDGPYRSSLHVCD